MAIQQDLEGSESPSSLPASFGRVSLTLLAGQVHVNLLGNVHGGEVMRLVDSTAGAVAQRHSGGPAVTAAMDEMAFLAPVHVGDILRATAQVNWAGRTSMEVGVRVESEPWNQAGTEPVHVASAYLVFVAIDADGRPRQIPALQPGDPRRYAGMREAEIRRAHRLARKTEIDEGVADRLARTSRQTTRRAVTGATRVAGDTWRHRPATPRPREVFPPWRLSSRPNHRPRAPHGARTGDRRSTVPPGADAHADDAGAPRLGPGRGRTQGDRADRPADLVRPDRHRGGALRARAWSSTRSSSGC